MACASLDSCHILAYVMCAMNSCIKVWECREIWQLENDEASASCEILLVFHTLLVFKSVQNCCAADFEAFDLLWE